MTHVRSQAPSIAPSSAGPPVEISSADAEATVRMLLKAAGMTVSDEEFESLAAAYPSHRASLDALFAVPMTKEEEPQLIFSPLV